MGLQWSVGRKRYTSAELVRAASQVRNVSVSSHGPIVSLREGIGLRAWTAILNASDRNSNQLLISDITVAHERKITNNQRFRSRRDGKKVFMVSVRALDKIKN